MSGKKIQTVYPLSPTQQGMLFRSLYSPGSGVYVEQASYRITGALDPVALEAAWREALVRHDTLRTAFFWEGREEPLQVVFREVALDMECLDWRGEEETLDRLENLLEADRRRGFDLSKAPLLRWILIRRGDTDWQLVWTHHHILLDGWSVARLLGEVLALYAAETGGHHPPPPVPAPSYRDYIGWIRRQDREAAADFWTTTLAGLEEGQPLPLGSEAGTGKAFPEEVHSTLGVEETVMLEAAARTVGVTLNTMLQGALALLLVRFSGQEETVFGFTVSGRPEELPGVERSVGLFINSLPLVARCNDREVGRDFLRRLFRQATESSRFAWCTLPQIQGWSDVPQEQSLFETLLVFENYPRPESQDHGLELSLDDFRLYERTDYPLTLVAVPGERLRLTAVHDPERLSNANAERLLRHLHRLLLSLANNLEAPLGNHGLIPLEEIETLRPVVRRFSEEPTLTEGFRRVVARNPDAVAVSCGGEELTYAQLADTATRLARHLRSRGVAPGDLVGLSMERSIDLVVAVLGILMAGAAYLPLDPAYPVARRRYMLADGGSRWLVTHGDAAADLLEENPGQVEICSLDTDAEAIAAEPAEPPMEGLLPHSLAYVIYTSGSTGEPKGVMVEHAQVVRLFQATEEWFHFGPKDVWTLFHSYSFDFSVWELWGALLYGGRLVVVPHGLSRSPQRFYQLLVEEGVTVLNQTPSAFRQLLAVDGEDERRDALCLREVIFGGEALDPRILQPWFDRHPERPRMVNMYGITETTVHVTFRPITPADFGTASFIGESISDLETWVLDPAGRLMPSEAPGEIFVGGRGLARGYLGRPALTASRFVPNPFTFAPGTRLYRTGDRARRLSSGELEFLGRVDQQVKIRGFRIEPGEIEAALMSHDAVGQAVVLAIRDPLGEGSQLATWWVPSSSGTRTSETELRVLLRERLPEYMVPAYWVELPNLPLTNNGKLDYRALPAPGRSATVGVRMPRTPVEQAVAEIWAEVLECERVGIDENFYDLGGHSLVATRLASRLRRAFPVDLSVRTVLKHPTVAELAEEVQRALGSAGPVQPSLEPAEHDGTAPLSFGQERLWMLDRLRPGDPAWNVSAGLRLQGILDTETLGRAFAAVVARHEALRTTFETDDDGWPHQRIAGPWVPHLGIQDLGGLPVIEREREMRRQQHEIATAPFDLAGGPLLRLRLLRLSAEEHLLFLGLHHIVCDGWSMGVLVREVVALYRAEATGKTADLAPLPVQYPDYAIWQRGWLEGQTLEAEIEHWQSVLEGPPPDLALPYRGERPEVQTFRGTSCPVLFPQPLAIGVRDLARRSGTTLFTTLLAAMKALLWRYTQDEVLWVGMPVAGRGRLETEGLIGFFLNTLVIRSRIGGDEDFRTLVGRVKEAVLDAYAHQEVPYEKLMRGLAPERDPARPLVPQVLFLLQNYPLPEIEVPGLTVRPMTPDRHAAQSDLALELEERGGTLVGLWAYNADLFDSSTIERLNEHFLALLEAIVESPDRPLAELSMLTAAEKTLAGNRFSRDLETW